MRKLDTGSITNTIGMPIKSGTLVHLQDAYTEAIAAVMQSQIPAYDADTVYVLYGCVAGTTTESTGNGQQIVLGDMSAGAIFYNGEVFLSPYQVFQDAEEAGQALVATISTGYYTDATADPVVFTDGVSRNVHQIRTVSYGIATSSSGIADYNNFVRIFPAPLWSSADLILATITASGQNYTWTNVGAPYYNAGYKVSDNEVTLCGAVTNTIPEPGTLPVFTLPAGARPASEIAFYLNALVGDISTGSVGLYLVQVNTSGQVVINTPAGGVYTIYFDNVKFRLS
jgi:hypothetical protein